MSAPTIDIRLLGPNDAQVLGCNEAWGGTERTNTPARRLYAAAGGKEEPEDVLIVSFSLE